LEAGGGDRDGVGAEVSISQWAAILVAMVISDGQGEGGCVFVRGVESGGLHFAALGVGSSHDVSIGAAFF
jgi:hypothetical protein